MTPNEHSSPYGRQPYSQSQFGQPKPRVVEDALRLAELPIERKIFVLTLKENPRGRFLRITEGNGTLRASVIVPATGLRELQKVLAEMVKAHEEMPEKDAGAHPAQ